MPTKIDRPLLTEDNSYEEVANSKYGIYGYFTSEGECIYIGIDSNINKKFRHLHHTSPSKRAEQEINRYIQSDAGKDISYAVLHICRDKVEMENLETMYILFYKALGQCRFNKVIALSPELSTKLINGIADIGRN